MVPGMGHCGRGPGPNSFGQRWSRPGVEDDVQHDVLSALDHWVEKGESPARLIATKYSDTDPQTVTRTMPLCPFPAMAKYVGTGKIEDAGSWTCSAKDHRADEVSGIGLPTGVKGDLR